jgi:two-component system, NarL family, invasion response regulator UvrY
LTIKLLRGVSFVASSQGWLIATTYTKTELLMKKSERIRIIIADDHQLIRQAWKLLLENDGRFVVVGECADGQEAIVMAGTEQPDIILMDINMEPVNGFEATRKISGLYPGIRIIGISVNDQPSYARNMMRLGAKGFVTKDSTKDEMAEAIVTVHAGDNYICRALRNKMQPPEKDNSG